MGNRVGRARRGGPQEAGFQLLGDEDDTHVAIELGVPDEDAKDAPRRPSYGALPPDAPRFYGLGRVPEDCMIHIFSFLGQTDLARCVQVSRSWRLAAYDPSLHKSLSLTHLYNSVSTKFLASVLQSPRYRELEVLSLERCTALSSVRPILRYTRRLRVLLLTACVEIPEEELFELSHLRHLQKLELCHTAASATLIEELLRLRPQLDLGMRFLEYCAERGLALNFREDPAARPACRHQINVNRGGCWGAVVGRVIYSNRFYPLPGAFPHEVLYSCAAHQNEDARDETLFMCDTCRRFFRRDSMWNELFCRSCFDMENLHRKEIWVPLDDVRDVQQLTFSDLMSRGIMLADRKDLPWSMRLYGHANVSLDLTIPEHAAELLAAAAAGAPVDRPVLEPLVAPARVAAMVAPPALPAPPAPPGHAAPPRRALPRPPAGPRHRMRLPQPRRAPARAARDARPLDEANEEDEGEQEEKKEEEEEDGVAVEAGEHESEGRGGAARAVGQQPRGASRMRQRRRANGEAMGQPPRPPPRDRRFAAMRGEAAAEDKEEEEEDKAAGHGAGDRQPLIDPEDVPLPVFLRHNQVRMDEAVGRVQQLLREAQRAGERRGLLVFGEGNRVSVLADKRPILDGRAGAENVVITLLLWRHGLSLIFPFIFSMLVTVGGVELYRRMEMRLLHDAMRNYNANEDMDDGAGRAVIGSWIAVIIILGMTLLIVICAWLFARYRETCERLFRRFLMIDLFCIFLAGGGSVLVVFASEFGLVIDALSLCLVIFNFSCACLIALYKTPVPPRLHQAALMSMYTLMAILLRVSLPAWIVFMWVGVAVAGDVLAEVSPRWRNRIVPFVYYGNMFPNDPPHVLYTLGSLKLRASEPMYFALLATLAPFEPVRLIVTFVLVLSTLCIAAFVLPFLGKHRRPLPLTFFSLIVWWIIEEAVLLDYSARFNVLP